MVVTNNSIVAYLSIRVTILQRYMESILRLEYSSCGKSYEGVIIHLPSLTDTPTLQHSPC